MATAHQLPMSGQRCGRLLGTQFARHMQLRGRRIVERGGVLWQSVKGGMFISIPCYMQIETPPEEINAVIRAARAVGVRFPSLTRPGLPGGLYTYRGRTYDIPDVHRHFRRKVRHGLTHCEVRRVEYDELLGQGMALNLETMQRQNRFDAEFGNPSQWKRLVDAVFAIPAMDVVGAFVDGHLAAYEITCREDGWLTLVHKMSRLSDLEHCPNHVLDFCITQQAVGDPSVQAITMGWQSLGTLDGLHEYKGRMGYQLEPHHTVIQLHPAVSRLMTAPPVLRVADRVCRWRSDENASQMAAVLHGAAVSRSQAAQGVEHV